MPSMPQNRGLSAGGCAHFRALHAAGPRLTFAFPAVLFVHYFTPVPPMSLARDVRGYTLLELLATLTILGVLASLAAPALGGIVDRVRARAALDRVESDVYWARIQAIRGGRNVTVRFQPDPGCPATHPNSAAYRSYTILVADAAGPRQLRSVEIPTDRGRVCFEMNRSAELVFTSRGMLHAGQNRTLWATRGSTTVSLRVSRLGRILRDD